MILQTASSLELAWTIIAACGFVAAVVLFGHIWLSWRTVLVWINERRIAAGGPRHRFVLGFLVGFGLLDAVWVGFIALGVNAMLSPGPVSVDRVEAADRAGWILVGLELLMFLFQAVMVLAWTSLGQPAAAHSGARSPVALMFRAIDLGRMMGHTVSNDLQVPVAFCDMIANDPTADSELRERAQEALVKLSAVIVSVREMHATIRKLEGS